MQDRPDLLGMLGDAAPVLADAMVKGTVLLCLAAVAAAASRRRSSAFRHRLWALALGAVLAVLPASWAAPGFPVPILPPSTSAGPGRPSADVDATAAPAIERSSGAAASAPVPKFEDVPALDRPSTVADLGRPDPMPATGTDRAGRAVLVWSSGFLALGSMTLAGLLGNAWRRWRSRPLDDRGWIEEADALARGLGIGRRVALRTGPMSPIPMTWGTLRPVILLPEGAIGWPSPVRRVVLLHELAHVRRRDAGVLLIGRAAASAFWFHPLAWFALGRLRAEAEQACDDLVVGLGPRRSEYARQLVDFARTLRAPRLALAAPMSRSNTLEGRLMALFDDRRSHRPLSRRSASALFAAAVAAVAGLAMFELRPSAAAPPPSGAPRQSPVPTVVPPTPDEPADAPETSPITVTGRALGPDGRPIPGAAIYLASLIASDRRIAETITDAEGRYAFRDVPLTIKHAGPTEIDGIDQGRFQVFGRADDFGFAWRPAKWYLPRPTPPDIITPPRDDPDPPGRFEGDDPIVLDLRFTPAASFGGTIVDDRGEPVVGARLEIRNCQPINMENIVKNTYFLMLNSMNESDIIPASMKLRTTDENGRFEFNGMPINTTFWVELRAEGFPDRWVLLHTETSHNFGGAPDGVGHVEGAVDGSEPLRNHFFDLTLETPLDIPIRVVYGDSGAPASGVLVSAAGELVNPSETSGDGGIATLPLPTGRYWMNLYPEYGTTYLATERYYFEVGPGAPVEPIVVTLDPAAILEVTVLDEETGAPIAGVDLWRWDEARIAREQVRSRSWESATQTFHSGGTLSDDRGTLRALIEPGSHRIGVGWNATPRFYVPVERDGVQVDCRAGETSRLTFTMRRSR